MNTIKCDTCTYFDGWYCHLLRHPLENGYAMAWHSQHCDADNAPVALPVASSGRIAYTVRRVVACVRGFIPQVRRRT